MEDDVSPDSALAQLQAQLQESEADVLAGHTVPLRPVLDRLRASIRRMEASQLRQAKATTGD